jgi:hypothetical protein
MGGSNGVSVIIYSPPTIAMQIDQAQGITLRAFFEAVAQQTTPLPEDLKQQMSTVGGIFTIDLKTAINQIHDLGKHPRLEPIYSTTRQELQKYQPEELIQRLILAIA